MRRFIFVSLQKKFVQDSASYSADKEQLIFLVGFMGTGKTHWGRVWSQQSGYAFVDLDEEIESQESSSVADIFATHGEAYFRKLEAGTLRALAGRKKLIVACGGGTPCFRDNMDWMNHRGTTVWLKADAAFILENIKRQPGTRPLLQEKTEEELRGFIEQKLDERESIYSNATVIVEARSLDSASFHDMILQKK